MNSHRWGQYFQVSSNLAVLLGVALVIIQLRQNAELLELQIIKQEADGYAAAALETLPDNFSEVLHEAIEDPNSMSGADILTMDRYYWGRHITRWRGLYDLYERGLLEDSAWQRLVQEDISALDHPFGRAWWYEIREWETTLPDDLVNHIDSLLDSHPGQSQTSWVEALRRRTNIEAEKVGQ